MNAFNPMNFDGLKLGQELLNINTEAAQRMAQLATEGMQRYFETNQSFATRLGELSDFNEFVELQREYGETVFRAGSEDLQSQGAVIQEVAERTGAAVREAFSPESASA